MMHTRGGNVRTYEMERKLRETTGEDGWPKIGIE
jgi:hypothetical protein